MAGSARLLLAALTVTFAILLAALLARGRAPSAARRDAAVPSPQATADGKYSEHERGLIRTSYKNAAQHALYLQARARADAEGRQLVVIGDPSGGWINKVAPMYGCGDVCIDIRGCRPCPRAGESRPPRIFVGDALAGLRTVETDSAVVFESEVFEYPSDLPAVLREVERITGGVPGRVFAVHFVALGQEAAWRYHLGGDKPPRPGPDAVRRRREGRRSYAATGEGNARRLIYRYPPRDPYAWVELGGG